MLARRENSKKFALAHGLPTIDRMVLPRPSGFSAIIEQLENQNMIQQVETTVRSRILVRLPQFGHF